MKRFIKHIFLFIGFLAIFYSLLLIVIGEIPGRKSHPNLVYKKQGGHLHSRLQEAQKINAVDVLFIGSSHAYRGFDPRIFEAHGKSSFNLGSSSQAPKQTYVLLQKFLPSIKAKHIIFEVCPVSFSSDGIESSLDIVSHSKSDRFSLFLVLQLQHLKVFNTFIYSTIRQWIGLEKEVVEESIIGKDHYISGGFVEKQTKGFIAEVIHDPYDLNEAQLLAFRKIVDIVNLHNIELILVQAPVTDANYSNFSDHKTFDALMRSCADYYNFNEILDLEDSLYFYDSHHLNKAGVKVFNEELIRLLY